MTSRSVEEWGSTRRGALSLVAGVAGAPLLGGMATAEKWRVLQGPMVGAVEPDSALIWLRCGNQAEVRIAFSDNPQFTGMLLSEPVTATAENDFVAVVRLSGLKASTPYYYRVVIADGPDAYLRHRGAEEQSFRTAPPRGAAQSFRLCFGSCARYAADSAQRIWEVVEDYRPDLFCWLGDNIYADSLNPEVFAEEYRRQREVATLQPLLRRVPQLATWDDHDFGSNDDDRRNPIKAQTLDIFKRYWANPAAGLPGTPGVFFRHAYGAVDLFFLDDRYYRAPKGDPDGPGKTLLGERQLAWLKRELKTSEAPFKLLLSGSGWSKARGPGTDAWSAFLHERDGLFDFIRDEGVEGVVLLSGDTHVGELNCIPWSERGGYDLYDLVASPLAQNAGDSWLERSPERRIRQVCFNAPLFGVIDFEFDQDDPVLRFNIVTATTGQLAWEWFSIRASQLRNGVESWREAMDEDSRARHGNLEAGKY